MIFDDLLELDLLPDLDELGGMPPQIDLQADPDAAPPGARALADRLGALPEEGDAFLTMDHAGVSLDELREAVLASPLPNPFARGRG